MTRPTATEDGAPQAEPRVHAITFAPAPPVLVATGLLGWISLTVGQHLRITGIAMRRTKSGDLALSFPVRRDRHGIAHPIVEPVNDAVRRDLERQVFAELRIDPEAQP